LLLQANRHTVCIQCSNPRWKELEKQLCVAVEEPNATITATTPAAPQTAVPVVNPTEGDEDKDEDGLEYDFRWHSDGF